MSPAYIQHEMEGVQTALDGLLTRYHPALGGVLLSYTSPRFSRSALSSCGNLRLGAILGEAPSVHVSVDVDALLFSPTPGEYLHGTITSVVPGVVGLLVSGLITAAVVVGDMAGGYVFDESERVYTAVDPVPATSSAAGAASGKRKREVPPKGGNRLLLVNPPLLAVGVELVFRVVSLSYSGGDLQIWGSLADDGTGAAPPSLTAAKGREGVPSGGGKGEATPAVEAKKQKRVDR